MVYWSVTESADAIGHRITADDRLFRDYLNAKLFDHFKASGLPHGRSFLGGVEVWIALSGGAGQKMQEYRIFTLRVLSPRDQYATTGWSLLVSYQGNHSTHPKQIDGLDIPDDSIKRFVLDRDVIRKKFYDGAIPGNAQVVVNREIAGLLGIEWSWRRETNKYRTFYSALLDFYSNYLKGQQIAAMTVLESGLAQIRESQVWKTPVESNVLEFAEGRTHFNAYMGLKEYGPLAGPKTANYRFFFIFHTNSRDQANRLYQYLNRGFKGYPGLQAFTNVELALDRDRTIIFTDENQPSIEIDAALAKMSFAPNVTYFAFYLSPIDRDDQDADRHSQYYRIKQSLLNRNIGSQVVLRENIEDPNFNYFLPNISIAILAKLGGVPWRLSREVKDELVIGIGAYRQGDSRFLGTTFTFRNDGTFIGFDAGYCPNVGELGQFFEGAVRAFVGAAETIRRVVIHFFKDMSRNEEEQLIQSLSRLDIQVPYVVLSIVDNDHAPEYVVIDEAFPGLMPRSGVCVKLRHGDFLLCNNTRYQAKTATRIDDYPYPLKVSISKTNLDSLDEETIRELIDQVYQFSRVYWRSVKQRAMPVTILYSEKIARMAAEFPDKVIPKTEISRRTLWFL